MIQLGTDPNCIEVIFLQNSTNGVCPQLYHFLQQQSFIEQPQQEFPFLRLFMAPKTATMTRPVTAMIAMIVDAFIMLVQLNNLTMRQTRLLRTEIPLRISPTCHQVHGEHCLLQPRRACKAG